MASDPFNITPSDTISRIELVLGYVDQLEFHPAPPIILDVAEVSIEFTTEE